MNMENPYMVDSGNYTVCPACGNGNHKRSILCKFCGGTLIERLPRSMVTEKDMVFLLHVCVARAQFGWKDLKMQKSYLEEKLRLGYDQVLFEELGVVAAQLGSYEEALYYYRIAESCEPWISLTKPAEFEQKIDLLEKNQKSRSHPNAEADRRNFPYPQLDIRRFKLMLEYLRGPDKEAMAPVVKVMEAFEKSNWK